MENQFPKLFTIQLDRLTSRDVEKINMVKKTLLHLFIQFLHLFLHWFFSMTGFEVNEND